MKSTESSDRTAPGPSRGAHDLRPAPRYGYRARWRRFYGTSEWEPWDPERPEGTPRPSAFARAVHRWRRFYGTSGWEPWKDDQQE